MQFGGGGGPAAALGSTPTSTSDFVEGGDGGSYTYEESYSGSWNKTSLNSSTVQSLSFNNFADSGGVRISYIEGPGGIDMIFTSESGASSLAVRPGSFYYEELQAGRGSMYRSSSFQMTTDGNSTAIFKSAPLRIGPGGFGPVGNILSDGSVYYSNFESFFTSEGHAFNGDDTLQRQMLQSGFISNIMNATFNTSLAAAAFDDTLSADYAMDYFYSYSDISPYEYSFHVTEALLDFDQNHAWDLSTATLTSLGTYCGEGDVQSYVYGCVDFDISLTWDNDASGVYAYCRGTTNFIGCYGWPKGGLVTLNSDGATASYAFTPRGGTFTLDAGDGSAVFETNLTPGIDL